MKRADLVNNVDIWNAMVELMAEYDFPTDHTIANKEFMVYSYYAELESAGHEGLFNWFSSYIEEVGAHRYFKELRSVLEEMNAHEYALIETKNGEKLWELFQALVKDEIPEDDFYILLEKADQEYHQLNGRLEEKLKPILFRSIEN